MTQVYKMSSNPGRALIINNENFEPARKNGYKGIKDRPGSNKDESRIENLFKDFHFNVKVLRNKTAEEIIKICEDEKKNEEHENNDAFIMFILSHGSLGAISGVDGYNVNINAIKAHFDGDSCPHLRHKPKLFFFVACQGGNVAIAMDNAKPAELDLPGPPAVTGSKHLKADMWQACAAVEEYVSIRCPDNGTWFIQTLIDVFSKDCHSTSLDTMMKQVIHTVSSQTAVWNQTDPPEIICMIPEVKYTLTKEFYFFTGIGKETTIPPSSAKDDADAIDNVDGSKDEAGGLSKRLENVNIAGPALENQLRRQRGSSSDTEMEPNQAVNASSAKHSNRISEMFLRNVASRLGSKWDTLGLQLGFEWHELEGFSRAKASTHSTSLMLNKWKLNTNASKQKPALISALMNIKRGDLEKEFGKKLTDGKPVDDKELHSLAERIGFKREELATQLDVKSHEFEVIKQGNEEIHPENAAFDMLVQWNDAYSGEQDQIKYLQDKLKESKLTNLATDKDFWTNCWTNT